MQRYDIISKPYWSNCFIEAIRAKSKIVMSKYIFANQELLKMEIFKCYILCGAMEWLIMIFQT